MALKQIVPAFVTLLGDGAGTTYDFSLQNLAVPGTAIPSSVSVNNPLTPVTSCTVDANGNIQLVLTTPIPLGESQTFELDLLYMSGTSSSSTPNLAQNVFVVNPSGGGVQYADGASAAAPTGTVAFGKTAANIVKPFSLDTSGNLNVNLANGTISGGNAAASPTGAAVPASADYVGFNDSGNLTGVSTSKPLPVAQQGSVAVTGTFWQATQPVSASTLPLPAGASTAAKQPALGIAGTPSADVISVQGISGGTPQPVSGTVTANAGTGPFPVSDNGGSLTIDAASLPLPTGAATETTLGTRLAESTFTGRINTLGQKTATGSTPVVLASDQSAVPVTGTFFQATQPVSAAALPLPTGASTAAKQPALGTAGTPSADVISVQGVAGGTAQPISAASLPLPAGASSETTLGTRLADATFTGRINTQGQKAMAASTPIVIASDQAAYPVNATLSAETTKVIGTVNESAAPLAVTATGAAAAAVTLTLPAVAGQFHYITHIEITKYATAAITGGATPVLVTTTDLPGNPVFTFETAQAVGTVVNRVYEPSKPLKSSTVNTATTIVCPATTSVIWRVNVWYTAAP
jgi:hypothetical protein